MISDNKNDAKIALLIDADNVAVKYMDTIIDELSKYGDIIIRRVYGNWMNSSIKGWLENTNKYALNLIMQESNTSGKNATDICLVIDAMKLLYEGKADMFCIASSDGDFTKLAKEIRENGIDVIGMGEDKTPQSFTNACKKFVVLNQIIDEEEISDEKTQNDGNNEDNIVRDNIVSYGMGASSGNISVKTNITKKSTIKKAVIKIINDNGSKNKITGLGEVGSRLSRLYPEFDVRNYGFKNLTDFVESMDKIKVDTSGKTSIVKLKSDDKIGLEKMIIEKLKSNNNKMNLGLLKKKIYDDFYDVENEIRKLGYSKFSSYIKSLTSVRLVDNNNAVELVK
ncbi:MAG: NYN domain-containing protein [Lachnospiraceae bacterium]|nr:NYN domain-containing protein [Lachnospiraceae bacterium]